MIHWFLGNSWKAADNIEETIRNVSQALANLVIDELCHSLIIAPACGHLFSFDVTVLCYTVAAVAGSLLNHLRVNATYLSLSFACLILFYFSIVFAWFLHHTTLALFNVHTCEM